MITLEPVVVRATPPAAGGAPAEREAKPRGEAAARRLTAKERFALLEQFATLVDSGIQIAAALQSMRQQATQPRVVAVLSVLEDVVVGGQSLSQAMQAMPRAFPPMLAQMVRAGETTGALGDMLRRTVEVLEMEATLRSKLRSAMLYPCVMLVLTVSVVTFLLAFIVPKFERMFRGKQLPTPTRILMGLGDAAANYGLWALLALVVGLVATFLFLRTTRGVRFFDRLVLSLPVVGGMYRTAVLTRSVRTLGLLIQSGLPVHVALEHARDVAASPSYVELWHNARRHVLNGGSLTEALRGSKLIDPTFEQLVTAGEATAKLDSVMLKTATQYTRELERKIRDLLTLVEPLMVVMMGGVVGFVALSIMLPIFRMSRG